MKNLDKIQTIGPVKCTVTLKVPFINKSSEILEKKIKHLIRNTYYAANPRVVFTSKPLLTPGGKDPVSIFNIIMIFQDLRQNLCFKKNRVVKSFCLHKTGFLNKIKMASNLIKS